MTQPEAPQSKEISEEKKDLNLSQLDRGDAFIRLVTSGGQKYNYDLSSFMSDERRYRNLTISELSDQSGVSREDIVDLELGYIPLYKASEISKRLDSVLQLDEYQYKDALFKSSNQVKK